MQQLIETFRNAISSVLSQCSGVPWAVQSIETVVEFPELQIPILATGKLSGGFTFAFSSATGASLAQAMLMTPEPAAQFGPEEREAVEELFRQICGIVASALRPRFVDIGFQILSGTASSESANTWMFQLEHDGKQSPLFLSLSSEIVSALKSRAVETERHALHHALSNRNLELLLDVRLGVRLRFGSRRMRLREVLELHPGTVVELDRQVQEPVELLADTKLIAKGEVVVIDGNYGLRITDIVTPRERVESIQ